MIKTKLLITGISSLLVIGGTTAALTTHKPLPTTTHKAVQSVKVNNDDSGDAPIHPLTSESTETDPVTVDPITNAAPTPPPTDDNTADPAPAADPVETLHQTVVRQATQLAALFAPDNTDNFIYMQWYCLGRGIDSTTPQSTLDDRANFLVPTTAADGRQVYKYFTGGCRVIEMYR
jgi:cytoskeletal protein RodZ